MEQIQGQNLMVYGRFVGSAIWAFPSMGGQPDALSHPLSAHFTEEQAVGLRSYLAIMGDQCRAIGLTLSCMTVDRMIELLSDLNNTLGKFRDQAQELDGRLSDELKSIVFLHIEPSKVRYYAAPMDGLAEITDKFPSTMFDLEEASKCFALSRHTAVVFHLMRVMEIGLRVLGDTLRDPRIDPKTNPNWESILKKCREEQAKPLAERSPEWRSDEAFFSGASARLMAIKDAWRNPTMHVKAKYTEEEAEDILNHVKAFMRQLATKLSEKATS